MGSKDDELYTRWVQYGLYNPIMRLHSTSNEFMGKEPWKHNFQAETIATECLRQRHALIPYLYSMNYRTHKHAIALCEPMYYEYPDKAEAYGVRNQYFFGSELLVAPITQKINPKTNLASVEAWLPEGRWTDIYTGAIYNGGQKITMYRGIESIPVLAKEGAIIPLSANDRDNSCENPKDMILRIYRGNNTFELYEDDGISNEFKNGNYAITKYNVSEKDKTLKFCICPAEGNCSTVPTRRNYTLIFEDVKDAESITVKVNGKEINADIKKAKNRTEIILKGISPKANAEIIFEGFTARTNRDKKEMVIDLVTKYQLSVSLKRMKYNSFLSDVTGQIPVKEECFRGPIEEVQKMA